MSEKREYRGVVDISNAEYHASAGISRSGIKEFKKCPKKFWHRYLNPDYVAKEATAQMDLGTAFHAMVLEPEKFDREYVVKMEKPPKLPELPKVAAVGKEAYAKAKVALAAEKAKRADAIKSFKAFALGKTAISKSDLDELKLMKKALMEDKDCLKAIEGARYEQSIYWVDEDTGLLCKCRPDIWHNNLIVDLKTTKDASYFAFQRDFYNEGYHIQLGMIHLALKSIGIHMENFMDLAIEKEVPYCSAIFECDQSAIQHGIDEFKESLIGIKQCMAKNYWPSYAPSHISKPTWAKKGE